MKVHKLYGQCFNKKNKLKQFLCGDRLPNGSVYIDSFPQDDRNRTVLAKYLDQFVVWGFMDPEGHCTGGCYFKTIDDAANFYAGRIRND